MRGARPLTDEEIEIVSKSFGGKFALRDRAWFILGVRSGRRISQLLSITVRDTLNPDGTITDRIWFRRQAVKGKKAGQAVKVHPQAQEALADWLEEMKSLGYYGLEHPVFISRQRDQDGNPKPITRQMATAILLDAFRSNELPGRTTTHSMRKSFAQRAWEISGRDLYRTAALLGHENLKSTISYLSFTDTELDDIVLAM